MVSGALTVLLTAPAGIQATAPPGPPSWTPGDVWLYASDTGNVTKRVEVLGEEGLDASAVILVGGAAGAAVAGAEYWRRTRERRPESPPGEGQPPP